MTDLMWQGVACWLVILYPVWSPRCRRFRKRMRKQRVNAGIHVSPNPDYADTVKVNDLEADLETWGVGPDWEQDKPFPELFEEEDHG